MPEVIEIAATPTGDPEPERRAGPRPEVPWGLFCRPLAGRCGCRRGCGTQRGWGTACG
jgi:hypothetical protein